MSLVFAAGGTNFCDLLAKADAAEQAADAALQQNTQGIAVPDLGKILQAQTATRDTLHDAMAAADAATPACRTHALVIGVGEYPHLLDGGGPPALMALGLGQLTSSVKSAQEIVDWLLTSFTNEKRPLASIELLLSPGCYTPSDAAADKLGIAHRTVVPVERATLANIQAAFNRWLARCNHDRQIDPAIGDAIGDAALFFFSGHGLEKEVSLLLPEDFGAEPNAPLAGCIDLTTTHRRMGQCKADLQCYFIDACRETPMELLTSQDKPGVALKGDTGDPFLLRDAPIYQASAEGRQAFGPPGKSSYFTQQLIICFNGLGADRKINGRWRITSQSLVTGVKEAINRLPLVKGKRVTCDCGNGKSSFTRDLHFAMDPVPALVKVICLPFDAQALADLYLEDKAGQLRQRPQRAATVWVEEVIAGTYRPGAKFDPGAAFQSILGETVIVVPPDYPVELALQ